MSENLFKCKDCEFYHIKGSRVGLLPDCELGKWVVPYDDPCEDFKLRKGEDCQHEEGFLDNGHCKTCGESHNGH